MRREQSPWETIREETQKSRAISVPRRDLHHYLKKHTIDQSKEKYIIQSKKELTSVNFEDQATEENIK
jgi:hypothetical protein